MDKQFEYKKIERTEVQNIDKLNELGAQGWELVKIEQNMAIFKREKNLNENKQILHD